MALSSIRELARLAETSIASVSRVLNKRPGVNPETRARVEALVERHGFRPNCLRKNATPRFLHRSRSSSAHSKAN